VLLLILAAIAAIFAACAGSFLAGHAAGRVFGRSEAWDELVSSEAAALEALGVLQESER
jgi:hypothetical protein